MATTWYVSASSGSDSNTGTTWPSQAFATVGKALSSAASLDTIYIQTGTYIQTATLVWTQATISVIGFGTTPGDLGAPPLITTATNSIDLMSTSSNNGRQYWWNIQLTNTASSKGNGLIQTSQHGTDQWWIFEDCYLAGFTAAVNADNSGSHYDVGFIQLINCEITQCIGAGSDFYILIGATTRFEIIGCDIHGNTAGSLGQMIFFNGGIAFVTDCLITDNTVTGQIIWQGGSCNYIETKNCTFANNLGGPCLDMRNMGLVYNSLFYGNFKAIIADTTNDAIAANLASRNNAFGNNSNVNANWTNSPFDVTVTVNPFVNSSARNYALNNTSGGGLAVAGAGFPGPTFKSGATANSINIGAIQNSTAGGGGGGGSFAFLG